MNGSEYEVRAGDCIEGMSEMGAESVHAIVADPPYGLAFMGRSWDEFEPKEYQEFSEKWATEALRILKPGGRLLAFSGSRTHHRMFSGIEDAGFTIRDTLTWHYGQGFPKGQDIGEAIDGGEEAERWDGWNSALKPATEFIVMARKPFDGPLYENVLEHGTGALNVDGCRIPTDESWVEYDPNKLDPSSFGSEEHSTLNTQTSESHDEGRYPPNLILDPEAARMLDEQTGECPTGDIDGVEYEDEGSEIYGSYGERTVNHTGDSGGASRYFYCPKAKKSERTINGKVNNDHPTVKPLELMEWLITLVTREDQIVVDPFVGSGTTIMAARRLNRPSIGFELDEEYAELARERAELAFELETDTEEADPVANNPDTKSAADW